MPQTASLCGGAALAMVLRYWGEVGVRPEDFAAALSVSGKGITTDALRRLAEARGYRAVAFRAERSEAIAQLDQGRPLIALVASGKREYHYVVLLAWANGNVLVHDPAVAPFRVIPEAEWERRWSASGRWALLILPPERPGPAKAAVEEEAGAGDACANPVKSAVEKADRGDLESAQRELAAAAELCPESSVPLRESAGLELRRRNWARAAELAQRAVARNPDDALSWRLLATSRFLEGKPEAALQAWNRIGEPTLDLVRIDGLERTPFRSVYDYLGGGDEEVLTPESLRQAERRAAALPASSGSRVSYRPVPGGRAELEVAVVERPTVDPLPALLVESAARAFVDHAAALDLANVTASGDASRLFWRWQPNRPQFAFTTSAPRALGLPGIVTAQVLWDEQTYASAAPGPGALVRETRKRAALSLQDWRWADSKLELGVAVDEWNDHDRALSIAGGVDHRLAGDRVAVGGRLAGWAPLQSGAPFYAGSLFVKARSGAAGARRPALRLDLALEGASALAPLALWPGAGTGLGRDLLLRAHPLVRDGIIDGACFGRRILSAVVEGESPRVSWGPLALTAALFVDAARVLTPAPGSPPQTFVDVGAGLRLRLPGRRSTLRADIATPWGSARPRLSVGWQAQWPE